MRAIAAHGLRALSIPDLARSLGVTKGSFYWHFHSLKELIDASLRHWEELDRAALDEMRRIEDPRARLTALFVQAMEKSEAHALFTALSGSDVPETAALIRRISDRRIRLLVESYRELGFAASEARDRALLAYTAYIGALHLRRQGSSGLSREKELAKYVAHAVKTLIPD